jgi:DNA adenine methylase
MILRRLGNKKLMAEKIICHFPKHEIYIEPFFGAGGMFFNKPKVKYNVVNDLDSDVYNLFNVVLNQKEELREAFYIMPIHEDLLKYWLKNKETDPIKKAIRFLFLSNLGYMGCSSIKYGTENPKNSIYDNLDNCYKKIHDVQFMNVDFRKMFDKVSFRAMRPEKEKTFIYCDPPYLETKNNYKNGFLENDFVDLLNCLIKTGCKFAISEFDNKKVIELSKEKGLNIIYLGERRNLKNKRTEILITNYKNIQTSLF